MPTVAVLDALLLVALVVWIALTVVLLVARRRYEWRTRRLEQLGQRLRQARLPELHRLAARVTPDEFHRLMAGGIPPAVERALGRALLAAGQQAVLVRSARGESESDVWTRIRAAQVLASARSDAVYRPLDDMLRSGDPVLAGAALGMMVQLNDRRSAELLIGALHDNAYARSRIATAFEALSVDRGDTLRPLFDSDDPRCRYWAARLACFTKASEWATEVASLTADQDPYVRRAAVEALAAIGSPDDVGSAVGLLSDPSPVVRTHAARAVAAFSKARNAAEFRRLLEHDTSTVEPTEHEVVGAPAPGGDLNRGDR